MRVQAALPGHDHCLRAVTGQEQSPARSSHCLRAVTAREQLLLKCVCLCRSIKSMFRFGIIIG